MNKILAALALGGTLMLLAACGSSREEPASGGSFFNPVCMPDGSPVMNQLANPDGTFGDPRASFANCPWNKNKTN